MTKMLRLLNRAALTSLLAALAFAAPVAAQDHPATGTVSGSIREAGLGGAIATARVALLGTSHATLSRADGRFVLQGVPAGDYTLQVQSIGFREGVVEGVPVAAGVVTARDVSLSPAAISIEGIVVTPGRFGVMGEDAAAPRTMNRDVIETMPGLGEDIYRMVHRLPGVAADDYSAKFTIRGGGNDEVLVRLDGLTLFEPFHLKDLDGALSIVDVQAIRGLDLTTGGFTAENGNRLTGTMEMRTLRETAEQTRTSVGISLTNARLMSAGGFDGNRGNWLLSARRGYIDVLLKMIDPEGGFTPRYHDALAKIEYELSPRHVVSANVLTAGDALTMDDDHFDLRSTYGNHYGWVNWRAYPTDALSVQTVFSTGRLDWMRNVQGGAAGTQITELGLADERDFRFGSVQQDWSWRVTDHHLTKWGAAVRSSRATYDYARSQEGVIIDGTPLPRDGMVTAELDPSGIEAGAYVTHRLRVADPLTLELGLRYDHYSQSNESVVSPRFNLAYAVGENTTLRAAWGLYYQPQEVYQLYVQDGDPDFYQAERAEHRVVGIDHLLPSGVTLHAEAYQRVLSRMRPRYESLFNVNSGIEEAAPDRIRLEPSSGEARGVEVFASSDAQAKVRWHAGYTFASIEDIIDGKAVSRGVDQRHSALLELGYRPSARWSLSSSWQIRSGRPYTSSSIASTTLPDGSSEHAYVFGSPYAERLDSYHRLDLRVTRRFDLARGQLAVFFDMFNVYDRENARGWSSSLEDDGSGAVRVEEGAVMNLPMLPSVGVTWEF
ncbi:MAG: TonB-dependent receptor [Gemmatimonadota bacterium]